MANRWLRGVKPWYGQGDSSNQYMNQIVEHDLFIYYFLRRLCGWTKVQEYVAGSYDPSSGSRSFEYAHGTRTGTDGVLTNSDLTFTSASAPFVSGDVNKFLCIVDGTNDVNCGIYRITGYTSSTVVTIDFLVPGGTYPTSATGLTWYLLDGSASTTPNSYNDWFVLQSPHGTYPCQVKGRPLSYGSFSYMGLGMTYATEGSAWDTSGHAWTSGKAVLTTEFKITRGAYGYTDHAKIYAYAPTSGDFLSFFTRQNNGGGAKDVHVAALLTPFETTPARTARERWAAFGVAAGTSNNTDFQRNVGIYDVGQGQVFSEIGAVVCTAYWMDWRDLGSQSFMRRNMGPNHRTSNREAMPVWVLGDPASANGVAAPWGYISTDYIGIGTVNSLSEYSCFDSYNRLHVRDDVVIPWAGVNIV